MYKSSPFYLEKVQSRFGLVVKRYVCKRTDLSPTLRFGSPFSSQIVDSGLSCDTALHNLSNIKTAHNAARLNADIIMVVTVRR